MSVGGTDRRLASTTCCLLVLAQSASNWAHTIPCPA